MWPFDPAFWRQPIDLVLYGILVWFGWIPILVTMIHGFTLVWKDVRTGRYKAQLRWVVLAVDVPLMTEQSPKAMENFFANLAGAYTNLTWKEKWIIGKNQGEFSFEIISTEGHIQFYARTQTRWRDTIEAGIYAHYPDAEITEVEDYTLHFPAKFPDPVYQLWGAELRLKQPEYFPIRTYKEFEDMMTKEIKDPLGHTLEQMSRMRPGEHFWIQILLQVRNQDWKKKGIEYIEDEFGSKKEEHGEGLLSKSLKGVLAFPGMVSEELTGVNIANTLLGGHGEEEEEDPWKFFRLDPLKKERGEGVLRKISKPGHNVKIRILYIAKKEVYNKLARTAYVKGMFTQFAQLNMNEFGLAALTVPKDDYFWQRMVYTKKQTKLITAYRKRDWGMGADPMLLNTEELATIWHFPAIGIKTPFIKKTESRRGEPPIQLPIGGGEELLQRPEEPPEAPVAPAFGVHEEQMVHVEPPLIPKKAPAEAWQDQDALPTPDLKLPGRKLEKKGPPSSSRGEVPPNLPI